MAVGKEGHWTGLVGGCENYLLRSDRTRSKVYNSFHSHNNDILLLQISHYMQTQLLRLTTLVLCIWFEDKDEYL